MKNVLTESEAWRDIAARLLKEFDDDDPNSGAYPRTLCSSVDQLYRGRFIGIESGYDVPKISPDTYEAMQKRLQSYLGRKTWAYENGNGAYERWQLDARAMACLWMAEDAEYEEEKKKWGTYYALRMTLR